MDNGFVRYWDDDVHLLDNYQVRSLTVSGIKEIFTNTVNTTYIPLTTLSFAFEYNFFKYQPFSYHLINLLLHLIVISLVFFFVLELGGGVCAASFSSLLFAIHPMHVESVAWVTARKDVLYSCFYLAALIFYCRYISKGSKIYYAAVLFAGFLSILAKPMALSLPLILLLLDWFYKRRYSFKVLVEKVPFFIVAISIGWLTYSLHARIPGDGTASSVLIWIWSFCFYLIKFVFPYQLVPIYSFPQYVSIFHLNYFLSICVFALVSFCFFRFRRNRFWIFAVLFYSLSIFFLCRFDFAKDISIVADRYMYLPSVGFCLFCGICAEKLLHKCRTGGAAINLFVKGVMIAVILLLGTKTFMQNDIWKDDRSIWTYVIEQDHTISIAYNNRGCFYRQRGELSKALGDFNRSLELNANSAETFYNRGCVFMDQKKYANALEDYNKATGISAEYPLPYNNRGIIYAELGEKEKAVEQFRKALELDSTNARVYYNLGLLYQNSGDIPTAGEYYRKAIRVGRKYSVPEFLQKVRQRLKEIEDK